MSFLLLFMFLPLHVVRDTAPDNLYTAQIVQIAQIDCQKKMQPNILSTTDLILSKLPQFFAASNQGLIFSPLSPQGVAEGFRSRNEPFPPKKPFCM